MYAIPSTVNLGLKEGQAWPSDAHEEVARTITLGNPNVTTRDKLTEVVQAILLIPQDEIESISYTDLVERYAMPDVGMYR